jgi:hypothetical protein
VLQGLLTMNHSRPARSGGGLISVLEDLPLLSRHDEVAIAHLASSYDIDFLALTFTRDEADVRSARAFLDGVGLGHTKILAKARALPAVAGLAGCGTVGAWPGRGWREAGRGWLWTDRQAAWEGCQQFQVNGNGGWMRGLGRRGWPQAMPTRHSCLQAGPDA